MNNTKPNLQQQSFTRRFVFPAVLIFAIWLCMKLIYETTWRLNLGEVKNTLSWFFGLGNEIFRMAAPIIAYPIAYFRGATPKERILACLTPCLGWYFYQLYLAFGVFSLGETLYYGLSSACLFSFFNTLSVMGVCELICRNRLKKRGEVIKTWNPIAIGSIFLGPASAFLMLVWGGGTHWFYIYIEGYKFLFH